MLQRNSPSYKSWMASEESKTEAARCAAQGAALASALQVQFDKIADSLTSRLDNVVGFQNVVGSQGRFRMSSKQPPPDGHSHDKSFDDPDHIALSQLERFAKDIPAMKFGSTTKREKIREMIIEKLKTRSTVLAVKGYFRKRAPRETIPKDFGQRADRLLAILEAT